MKRFGKSLVSMLCVAMLAIPVFAGCSVEYGNNPNPGPDPGPDPGPSETVDYVSQVSLDFSSETKKQEVEPRLFIDGDTTHFDPVKNSTLTTYHEGDFDESDGYIKARYLAVNTPESTGTIEKWGKSASNFTRSKLETAEQIVVESDDTNWNFDSTASKRLMLWVWYKPEGEDTFRNLNIELLQEGYARASSTASTRYGTVASAALAQARAKQLKVFSPEDTVDPNFYEGDAIPITLKELRCHLDEYVDKSVCVEGVITAEFSQSVYIEDFDAELGVNFGISVYYGYNARSQLLSILKVGSRLRFVGSITIFNDSIYQLSGIDYDPYGDPTKNTTVISEDNDPGFAETDPAKIAGGTLDITFEDDEGAEETVTLDYGRAILNTAVYLKNLTCTSVYTTDSGNSAGAMTLTCTFDNSGKTIQIRTEVLYKDKENTQLVTEADFLNKKFNVKGLVEEFSGQIQIKCHRFDYFEFLA